jgi:perosamine synthetase
MAKRTADKLAVDGGEKAFNRAFPPRRLFGKEEKKAAMALFDHSIKVGEAFGYGGKEEDAYCAEFAKFVGGGYADAVNSGTSAVYVALRALQLEPFTEVICPPITDPGGVMPVPLSNLIPIPADAAPGTFNTGPDEIEARITPRTSAILVAHIAGIPVEMGPLMEIARAKNIPVIEDCAQAHAAKYHGKYLGTIGDIGAFSTMFGKHHATGGQGGIVFTKSKELYQKVRWYSDRGKPYGLPAGSSNCVASLNLNLNELSAAIGRAQLKKLPKIAASRQRVAKALDAAFRKLKSVRLVTGPKQSEPSYWFLLVTLDLDKIKVDKDTFVKAIEAEGVAAASRYVPIFTQADWYKNRAVYGKSGYPWTCPLYKGDLNRKFPWPNLEATEKNLFMIYIHESFSQKDVADTIAAFKKVEAAFTK